MQENINIPDSNITTTLTFRQLILMNMQQLTNFPYIEQDFDALTDYELLCLVVKYLNDVITNSNEQNTNITNLYNVFLELQEYVNNTKDSLETAFNNLDDYVRNYFANLDLQEEVNIKIDEMAEDGSLVSLFASFLPYATPEMFGAKGNGTDDDTTAFQAALNANKVVKAYKSYLLTDLTINDGNDIEFAPNTTVYRNKTDSENNSGLFVANGSLGDTYYALTGEVTESNNVIALNSVTGLSVGDVILLKNPSTQDDADSNKMLVSTITAISSNNVTLANPLQWDYPINSVVQKINPIHFKINGSGMTFTTNGLVGRGYFITTNYSNGFIVENINTNNVATGVIRIHYSINGIVKNCSGKNPSSSSAPYGEYLGILYSTNINCYNITGYNYRRIVDYVGSTYCNCYDSHGFQSGFTTHGLLAKHCSFINCNYEQLYGSINNPCVVGNLSYYYDKEINFINCNFMNGNRNLYLANNDCTVNVKNCLFKNSEVCIYNNGLNTNISDSNFINVKSIIINDNTSIDNIVNISNCKAITRGSASTNIIYSASTNKKTINNISNSSFVGTNKIAIGIYNINSSSFDFDPNTSIALDVGSRMYNSKVLKNISGNNNNKIFNSIFNAYTHTDNTNAENVIIEGCLNSGTINVANDSTKGNYIQNNTSIQNMI